MSEKIDYKEVGLKCGIEIHQRLDTNKLFCSCPSLMREDEPHFTVKRELRAVAGETGVIDEAALHEMEKALHFVYEGYNDTTCLVELDEEPPHDMNSDALNTGLQVSKMLNCNIVDEVQVMRKAVVNGSNTSGFQRTALVARDGWLETKDGKVGVANVSVEEDSAKDIAKKDGHVVYRLDRLGIPLVEIGTDPDIKTPEQCQETAAKIGMILRSTGKVARGIGTIRQDINVSIATGDRIEIKGAQDLKMIPTLVEYEARRQMALVNFKDVLKEHMKKIRVDDKIRVLDDLFKKSECKIVKNALSKKGIVKGMKIYNFNGLLGMETQPGKRIGSEVSDYAKVKSGVGGLFHSDELPKYGISEEDVKSIRGTLKCDEKDAFILVADREEKVDKALSAAAERLKMFDQGVMKEVRKANPDGTTSYMRPMPGAARMYPETDVMPIKVDADHIELPELLEEQQARFEKEYSLATDLARDLTRSGSGLKFESYVKKYLNVKPAFIAETMISTPKTLKRKYDVDPDKINDEDFEKLFSLLDSGKLTKDSVETLLVSLAKGEEVDYSKHEPLSDKQIESEIKKILKENEGTEFKAVVGKVMGSLKGRAEGKKIMELLKKLH